MFHGTYLDPFTGYWRSTMDFADLNEAIRFCRVVCCWADKIQITHDCGEPLLRILDGELWFQHQPGDWCTIRHA